LCIKADSNHKFGIFETFSTFDTNTRQEKLLEQMSFKQMSRNLKNNIVGHDIILSWARGKFYKYLYTRNLFSNLVCCGQRQ